jgi:hypothetical protein
MLTGWHILKSEIEWILTGSAPSATRRNAKKRTSGTRSNVNKREKRQLASAKRNTSATNRNDDRSSR